GSADHASPSGRALPGLQEDGGAEPASPVGGIGDSVDLDVRQPKRAADRALDYPSLESVAKVEGEVAAGPGPDPFRPPAPGPVVGGARGEQRGARGAAAGAGTHRGGHRDSEDAAELAHHAVDAGGLADVLDRKRPTHPFLPPGDPS